MQKRLYDTLLKLKKNGGLSDDLKHRVDVLFLAKRLSEEEYCDLMDVPREVTEDTVGEAVEESETETVTEE